MTIANQSAIIGFADDRAISDVREGPALGTVVVAAHESYVLGKATVATVAGTAYAVDASYNIAVGTGYNAGATATIGQYVWMKKTTSIF